MQGRLQIRTDGAGWYDLFQKDYKVAVIGPDEAVVGGTGFQIRGRDGRFRLVTDSGDAVAEIRRVRVPGEAPSRRGADGSRTWSVTDRLSEARLHVQRTTTKSGERRKMPVSYRKERRLGGALTTENDETVMTLDITYTTRQIDFTHSEGTLTGVLDAARVTNELGITAFCCTVWSAWGRSGPRIGPWVHRTTERSWLGGGGGGGGFDFGGGEGGG